VAILPYFDPSTLYSKFRLDEPWDSPNNLAQLDQMPFIYGCPSDPTRKPGTTGYQAVVGPPTAFTPDFKLLSFQDIPTAPHPPLTAAHAPPPRPLDQARRPSPRHGPPAQRPRQPPRVPQQRVQRPDGRRLDPLLKKLDHSERPRRTPHPQRERGGLSGK